MCCLAGGRSHDSQGRDDRAIRGVKTSMQGMRDRQNRQRDRQNRQRACELSYERRVMPLRYCAMRGWHGPHAVIVIGGFGQLSAEILAERGGGTQDNDQENQWGQKCEEGVG